MPFKLKLMREPTDVERAGLKMLADFVNTLPDDAPYAEHARGGMAWLAEALNSMNSWADRLIEQEDIIKALNARCDSLEAIVNAGDKS